MILAGIDPGFDGALAVHDMRANTARVADTPATPKGQGPRRYLEAEMAALLREFAIDVAIIERQQAFPEQGSSSSFTTGVGYGLWRGMLAALTIPYEIVSPTVWVREVGLPKGGGKGSHRALAQQVFPAQAHDLRLVKHDGRADALLLAHWGARHRAVASAGG